MTIALPIRMAQLQGHQCEAKGCTAPINRIGRWCRVHQDKYSKYGSPTGRRLKRDKDYQWEWDLVKELVGRNREHPGLVRAQEWVSQFFPPEVPGQVAPEVEPKVKPESRKALTLTFFRLSDGGITPLDVIIEAAALYVVSEWRSHFLDDQVALTRQTGTQVIFLAVLGTTIKLERDGKKQYRTKRIPNSLRHLVGAAIRGALGSLLLNMAQSVIRKVEADEQAQHDLRKPFSI